MHVSKITETLFSCYSDMADYDYYVEIEDSARMKEALNIADGELLLYGNPEEAKSEDYDYYYHIGYVEVVENALERAGIAAEYYVKNSEIARTEKKEAEKTVITVRDLGRSGIVDGFCISGDSSKNATEMLVSVDCSRWKEVEKDNIYNLDVPIRSLHRDRIGRLIAEVDKIELSHGHTMENGMKENMQGSRRRRGR